MLYAALLFVVLKRLDVNMLSSLQSAGLKLSAAAFSANASWVTVASCLGLQVVHVACAHDKRHCSLLQPAAAIRTS